MSQELPTVTVGITSFNAREYIETCLESVAVQTLDPFRIEVIVVDDGSDDGSAEMALAYEARAPWARFSVLTQPNSGGPAKGRNRIIDGATGDYIFFVDVDDYLGPRALESMLRRGAASNADVVIGRFVGVRRSVPSYIFQTSESHSNIEKLSLTDSMNVLKMFKTDFVRRIDYRFNPSIRMAEDHPFALASYAWAENVAIEADTDCYFCVRHVSSKGEAQHLTGHTLPVETFYAYMHESFGVLAHARARHAPFVEAATVRYWDRLLSFDIPRELLRDRDAEDTSRSVEAAREIAEVYGAHFYANRLRKSADAMLGALRIRDEATVKSVAHRVQTGA